MYRRYLDQLGHGHWQHYTDHAIAQHLRPDLNEGGLWTITKVVQYARLRASNSYRELQGEPRSKALHRELRHRPKADPTLRPELPPQPDELRVMS